MEEKSGIYPETSAGKFKNLITTGSNGAQFRAGGNGVVAREKRGEAQGSCEVRADAPVRKSG
jgi:hypothetical protein